MTPGSLEVRLLGPLEVLTAGRPTVLPPSKKARALLAYLATTGRPHGRSALCDLFWKDVVDPRAGLRWALSAIRPVVDEAETPRIVASRDRVAFQPVRASVDLERVRSVVGGERIEAPLDSLQQAVRAFRGEFLEDLELPNCHEYQTWCLGMRERTRRIHLSVREALTERLRDDPDAALHHALVRLRLDPFSEDAYVAAIDVLADLGRVDRGQELYDQCRRMLADELGVSPSPALLAARRRLRPPTARREPLEPGQSESSVRQSTTPPIEDLTEVLSALPPPAALPEPGPHEPRLVGRTAELGTLVRWFRAVEHEERRTVALVVGEPGIGKTRLLRELVRQVRRLGGWVLSGPVFESEEIRPYGPWIDLVRSLPPPALGAELERELGALLAGPRPDQRDRAPTDRDRLMEAVARLLARLAGTGIPGLVVLDDIQWLDASSAALLHYVARTLTDAPLLLAVAAREQAIEQRSAPARLLRSLKEQGLLQTLSLRRLDAPETASLVHSVDGTVDPDRIFGASEGNPLFALAMAESARHGAERTPATIEEELADRLDRLDRDARSLVPWAAALGRAFDLPTLLHVVDRPAAEIVESVDHLERRGVIRATGADRYDFTHSLLRQAAYRRPSEPGRRAIHRSIARALERASPPSHPSPGAVAHHAERGGLPELAARSYLEAAEHSLWLFALDEAAAQVARGLDQLDGLAAEVRIPLEMGLLRIYGFRSMRDRRPADLESQVKRVTDLARGAGRTGVVAMGHAVLMELEYQRGALQDAARSSLRSAEAGRESEPTTAIRALAETAACLLLLDQAPDDARRLLSEATMLADDYGIEMDVVALARALLHHHDGDLDEAASAFREVVRLGRSARDRWWECPALTRMIMVELDRGDPERALTRAREAEELARRFGDETEAAFARGLGGVASARFASTERGAPERTGMDAVDAALQELRALDSLWTVAHVQAYAAEVELESGRPHAARARAEEADRAARTLDQPSLVALARSLVARSDVLQPSSGRVALLDSLALARPPRLLSDRARQALQRAREAGV